jgi:hypothetical protein
LTNRSDRVIDQANTLLGPFAAPRDLQGALLAYLDHAVAKGEAEIVDQEGVIAWRWAGPSQTWGKLHNGRTSPGSSRA